MKYVQEYYICDRCKKRFILTRNGYGACVLNDSGEIRKQFDLCLDCQDSLYNWMNCYNKDWQNYIKDKPYYKEGKINE